MEARWWSPAWSRSQVSQNLQSEEQDCWQDIWEMSSQKKNFFSTSDVSRRQRVDLSCDEEGGTTWLSKPNQLIIVWFREEHTWAGGPIHPRPGSNQVVTSPPCFSSMVFLPALNGRPTCSTGKTTEYKLHQMRSGKSQRVLCNKMEEEETLNQLKFNFVQSNGITALSILSTQL